MKKIILSIVTVTTLLLGSCGEESSFLTNVAPAEGAKVKFVHAAPDAPGVAIYVNEKKLSGILTVAPATPGVINYGGTFPATDYAVLAAGSSKLKLTIPSMSDAVALQADANFENGKYYSVFATGIAPDYSPIVVQDNIPVPSGNKIFIRLANLVSNSTDAEISIGENTLIKGVAANKVGDFVPYELPAYTGGTQNVAIVIKTNGNVPVSTNLTLSSYVPSRAVTVAVRGLLAADTETKSKYPVGITTFTNR